MNVEDYPKIILKTYDDLSHWAKNLSYLFYMHLDFLWSISSVGQGLGKSIQEYVVEPFCQC